MEALISQQHEVLAGAAQRALAAPSIFNTQPWRWVVGETLDLYADHSRWLAVTDHSGRMLLASCGAALHHARVALAGAGWGATVSRVVSGAPNRPLTEPLATIRLTDRVAPTPAEEALASAIQLRHTDRRPYGDELPDPAMLAIRAAVEAEGLRVHRVRWDQLPTFRLAAEQAAISEHGDPRYRAELRRWSTRPGASHDGVPIDTVVAQVSRPVPVRALSLDPDGGLPAPDGGDRHTSYLVLFGHEDEPLDWLRAGEALSAALLTGTAYGVAAAPMSDLIEVDAARVRVRSLLAGMGHPYLVLRCGTRAEGARPGTAPRRPATEVVEER